MPNALNTSNILKIEVIIADKPKILLKKNKQKIQNNNWSCNDFNQNSLNNKNHYSHYFKLDYIINRQKRNFYNLCSNLSHNFSKYYLILGHDSDLIIDEI